MLQATLSILTMSLLAFLSGCSDYQDGYDAYKRRDYVTALKKFRPLAEKGNSKAQFYLGVMYAHGKGVAQDDVEAVKWYRKAAEEGIASAQFNLSVMYDNGRGVVQNDEEAVKWYRKDEEAVQKVVMQTPKSCLV